MFNTEKELNVAVVQAAPVLFDREKTLEKVHALTQSAAAGGAKWVVFPESFIPAYPRGLSFGFVVGSRSAGGRLDWKRYYDHSVAVPGPATESLGAAAREHAVYLSIGVTEKTGDGSNATLYCTNLFFGPDGRLLGKHRKLKPTGSERCIWGEGDGSTLTTFDTPYGRAGSLICWENYMPLARAAMYAKGVTLYLAPTADSRDAWQATVRHIALEGRCYVFGCNQYVEKAMYPRDLHGYAELEKEPEVMCRGGSCIIDPFGEYVAGPVFGKEEILRAVIDLDKVVLSRMDFDPAGHYARNDVFKLSVNEG